MTGAPGGAAPVRWPVTALGTGLLLIVLAHVTSRHYLQVEWHIGAPVPVAWWFAGEVAATLGPPLFFAAAGLCLSRDQRAAVPVANLGWYALSVVTCLVLLWRFGAVFGLTPVRDPLELARLVAVPPAGPAPAYALAAFPVFARLSRRVPAPVVLGAAASAALLLAAFADRMPVAATATGLTRYLLFFLLGCRLGDAFEAVAARASVLRFLLLGAVLAVVVVALDAAGVPDRLRPLVSGIVALGCGTAGAALLATRPAVSRILAEAGHGAAVIAAALVPVTALAGVLLVKRLSIVDGRAELVAAVAEPALLALMIIATGPALRLVTHRITAARRRPTPSLEVTR